MDMDMDTDMLQNMDKRWRKKERIPQMFSNTVVIEQEIISFLLLHYYVNTWATHVPNAIYAVYMTIEFSLQYTYFIIHSLVLPSAPYLFT